MNINTRNLSFVNFNNEEMNWVKFNGVTIYESWRELIKSGVPPLKIYSSGADLINYKMYGNSVQNGTPTLETPIDIESIGIYDETTGKYKIPVKVSNGTEVITTNIYLDEPLRRIPSYNDYADYIDFENSKVVRGVREVIFTEENSYRDFTDSLFVTGFYVDKGLNSADSILMSNVVIPKRNTNIGWRNNNANQFQFQKSWLGVTTLDEFKEKLRTLNSNGTPLKIYYVLATPTEEIIELPNIPTTKGNTTIEIDATIQPSNMEVIYKGK